MRTRETEETSTVYATKDVVLRKDRDTALAAEGWPDGRTGRRASAGRVGRFEGFSKVPGPAVARDEGSGAGVGKRLVRWLSRAASEPMNQAKARRKGFARTVELAARVGASEPRKGHRARPW